MTYVAPTTRSSGNLGDVADYNILCNNDIEIESRKDQSFVTFTTSVATATTVEASSTTIVTAGAVSCNGTDTYEVQFFCPRLIVAANAGGNIVVASIFDGSTQVGRLLTVNQAGTTLLEVPVNAAYRLVPTNASHTYSIRAYHTNAACTFSCNTGGTGLYLPGFIRVRKVQ